MAAIAPVVNETVNATATAVTTGQATQLFFTVVIPDILSRFWIFFSSPFIYTEMWWLLVHLILTWLLFEFYFDRHEDEDLGWSAALANSIVMVFIAMELLRTLYHHKGSPFHVFGLLISDLFAVGFGTEKMVIVAFVVLLGALGLATAVINYFHFLPRRIAFLISGHHTVNILAYFLIILTYRYVEGHPVPLDTVTFVGLGMFVALLWGILTFINRRRKRSSGWSFFK